MTDREYQTDSSQVVSVWSAHGHHFMSGDVDDAGTAYESCLKCGALYQLLAYADDLRAGAYLTAAGDPPADCTGDTSMVHGYPGERNCESCDDHGCAHCTHDCPCLLCDS